MHDGGPSKAPAARAPGELETDAAALEWKAAAHWLPAGALIEWLE
jgi:hypothetical protein